MKTNCNIIKDLLPLYVDGLTSEDSNKIIIEHIKECKNCNDICLNLKTEINVPRLNTQLSNKSSRELFKKVRNKMIAFIAIALVAGILTGVFGGNIRTRESATTNANKFFRNLINNNYEDAFQYLYYYDVASDLEPQISFSKAKSIWVNRVMGFKEKGIYIKKYTNLKVEIDDTYPHGKVNLLIVEDGQEKIKEMTLWFGPTNEGWKIGNIYGNSNQENEFEKAISGFVKEE